MPTHFDIYYVTTHDDHDTIDVIDPDVFTDDDRRAALVKLRTAINRELNDDCTRAHYHPHHHDELDDDYEFKRATGYYPAARRVHVNHQPPDAELFDDD
jgi:hypothetical protein